MDKRILHGGVVALAAWVAMASAGCVAVQPWEREVLARPDMAWEPDPPEAQPDGHIAFIACQAADSWHRSSTTPRQVPSIATTPVRKSRHWPTST